MFKQAKFYVISVIVIALIALATMGFRWFVGIQAEVRNLQQANAEYSIQVNALDAEKQSNEALIETLRNANEAQAEALARVNSQFDEIRDIRERQQRVLEGSRLGRLAAERAGLIEGRANAATAERFTEFEGVINEDF